MATVRPKENSGCDRRGISRTIAASTKISNSRTNLLVRDLRISDESDWRRLYLHYMRDVDPSRAALANENGWQSFISGTCLAVFKVCEVDGSVVGFANGLLHDDIAYGGTVCYLHGLYVGPESRNRGVASALLGWFRDAVVSAGWSQLHWAAAASNAEAARIYERFADHCERSTRYVIWGS